MKSLLVLSLAFTIYSQQALANPASQIFGAIDNETPSYDVIFKGATYEVRRYLPQLWAQVDYYVDPATDFSEKGSIGFRPLFQYISGENNRKQKIPMTTPVIMQQLTQDSVLRRMAFIMPASLFSNLDQLPKPMNPKVKLAAANEPLKFACITFNMGLTSKRIVEKEANLRNAANNDQILLTNQRESIRIAGYNPPWTLPWFRKNDLCIPLVNQA